MISLDISSMILDFTDMIQDEQLDMDRGDLQGLAQAIGMKIYDQYIKNKDLTA